MCAAVKRTDLHRHRRRIIIPCAVGQHDLPAASRLLIRKPTCLLPASKVALSMRAFVRACVHECVSGACVTCVEPSNIACAAMVPLRTSPSHVGGAETLMVSRGGIAAHPPMHAAAPSAHRLYIHDVAHSRSSVMQRASHCAARSAHAASHAACQAGTAQKRRRGGKIS